MKTSSQLCVIFAAIALCTAGRLATNEGHAGQNAGPNGRELEDMNWKDSKVLEGMFMGADVDGNGFIDLREHLDYFSRQMTPLQLRMMFLAADRDSDKEVTFDELMEFKNVDWRWDN